MSRRVSLLVVASALVALTVLSSSSVTHAESTSQPRAASSPIDLVNAVNGLRTSYGLPPYSINSILMSTAQAQADFLALTGSMTHSGPGGISFTDRLLAAGYPLAGDLSLGGFRAENITGGPEDMPAEAAVNRWTGDAPHLNTMISPNLTEIGAGVSVNNGRVYYVIDAALPTTSGLSQAPAVSSEGGSPVPVGSPPGVIFPVTLSTPNPAGELTHEVKPGQSLWLIAIAYETRIDEIKTLNNLFDNGVYPGQRLLIKAGVSVPTALPSETPTKPAAVTTTSFPTSALALQNITSTVTPVTSARSSRANKPVVMKSIIGIIALALLGGWIFSRLGTIKKN
ncbi:MAG TPA: CAP domain-containing protein [Anaerolineales bacterium]|nr:CAP domain-containing protein [Anaerolineales bacterium]